MKKILFLAVLLSIGISCSKKADTTGSSTTSSTSGTTSTTSATSTTSTTNSTSACTMPLTLSKLNSIQLFPSSYALNQDISSASVDANSSTIISALGNKPLHNDFGTQYGIPFTLVCGSQPKVPITYRSNTYDGNYGSESDAGPFPIPATAPIEGAGNGDSHVLVCDVENSLLYELYNSSKNSNDNGWSASCGVVFDLKNIPNRPTGYTSADASGFAILPWLVRYDEVASGEIKHAIRFTVTKSHTYAGYVDPANHKVSGTGSLGASLPMGARLRLKSNVDISGYSASNQVILKAMKKYGIVLADIGSDMYITGAPDSRWDDDDLHKINGINSSDFEVIKMGTVH